MRRLWKNVSEKYPDWQLHIHHNTKDVVKAYTAGSIFIMTSRFEGFPLVLIEAMQCGLPCIAFDCPHGPAELLAEDRGFLVSNGEIRALSAQIEYAITHPEEAAERARKA